MYSIMLMTLQELRNSCTSLAGRPVILCYLISLQMGKRLYFKPWASCVSLSHQAVQVWYQRPRSASGKVTVDLGSHWPCLTDLLAVYPSTGSWSKPQRKGDSTMLLQRGMARFSFTLIDMQSCKNDDFSMLDNGARRSYHDINE